MVFSIYNSSPKSVITAEQKLTIDSPLKFSRNGDDNNSGFLAPPSSSSSSYSSSSSLISSSLDPSSFIDSSSSSNNHSPKLKSELSLKEKAAMFYILANVADRKETRNGGRRVGKRNGGVGGVGAAITDALTNSSHHRRQKVYRNCFVGSTIVTDMIVTGLVKNREEAIALGNHLERKLNLFTRVNGTTKIISRKKKKKKISNSRKRNTNIAQTLLLGRNHNNGCGIDIDDSDSEEHDCVFLDDNNAFYTFGKGALQILNHLDGEIESTNKNQENHAHRMNAPKTKTAYSDGIIKKAEGYRLPSSSVVRSDNKKMKTGLPSPPSISEYGMISMLPSPPSGGGSSTDSSSHEKKNHGNNVPNSDTTMNNGSTKESRKCKNNLGQKTHQQHQQQQQQHQKQHQKYQSPVEENVENQIIDSSSEQAVGEQSFSSSLPPQQHSVASSLSSSSSMKKKKTTYISSSLASSSEKKERKKVHKKHSSTDHTSSSLSQSLSSSLPTQQKKKRQSDETKNGNTIGKKTTKKKETKRRLLSSIKKEVKVDRTTVANWDRLMVEIEDSLTLIFNNYSVLSSAPSLKPSSSISSNMSLSISPITTTTTIPRRRMDSIQPSSIRSMKKFVIGKERHVTSGTCRKDEDSTAMSIYTTASDIKSGTGKKNEEKTAMSIHTTASDDDDITPQWNFSIYKIPTTSTVSSIPLSSFIIDDNNTNSSISNVTEEEEKTSVSNDVIYAKPYRFCKDADAGKDKPEDTPIKKQKINDSENFVDNVHNSSNRSHCNDYCNQNYVYDDSSYEGSFVGSSEVDLSECLSDSDDNQSSDSSWTEITYHSDDELCNNRWGGLSSSSSFRNPSYSLPTLKFHPQSVSLLSMDSPLNSPAASTGSSGSTYCSRPKFRKPKGARHLNRLTSHLSLYSIDESIIEE